LVPLTSTSSPKATGLDVAVVVEALVLHDQRDVVDPLFVRQFVGDRAVRVVEDEHAGQALVDVLLGLAVRVRVVSQRGRGLVDAPLRRPDLPWLDRLVRSAVVPGG
jgi:hypothetical protein